MKRSAIGLPAVADWHNLAAAFHRAARGKESRDDERSLQACYAAAHAITVQADAVAWRREQLRRRPVAAPLCAL
jgi:hypothetical protein